MGSTKQVATKRFHGEIELRGTQGTVYVGKKGYKVLREKAGQFQEKGRRGKEMEFELEEPNAIATKNHAGNFLECVRSREEANCPMIDGHRSTIFAHAANISLATKSRLTWDAENEKFDNDAANELLHYEYRKGCELTKF